MWASSSKITLTVSVVAFWSYVLFPWCDPFPSSRGRVWMALIYERLCPEIETCLVIKVRRLNVIIHVPVNRQAMRTYH